MTDWGTSAITTELDGAATGLNTALGELAAAARHAEGAADRMAAGQLYGVAEGLGRVKATLEADHRQVQAVADQATTTARAVGAVTARSQPDEVVAALSPVADTIAGILDDAGQALAALNAADTLIRGALRGGTPGPLLGYVTRAAGILRTMRARLDQAAKATDTVIANARQAGDGDQTGRVGGGDGHEPPGGPPPVPAGADDGPEPHGTEPPPFVRRIADQLPDPGGKTVGQLADRTGRPLGGVLWSGEDGPGRDAPGIRRDGPKPWHQMNTVNEHVEGHAAALLRRSGAPNEAVLVLTRPPCKGWYGCDRILPETLNRGARLWVYVVGKDGKPYLYKGRPFVGNGLGVER